MRKKIRVAIAGVGNCGAALIQGTSYYNKNRTESVGLTAYNLGGLEPGDIEFVAAFDVANSKVGQDLSEAIFAQPNNTVRISDVEKMDVRVEKGETSDGVGRHLGQKIKVSEKPAVDIKKVLKDTQTEILLNYLPVGSRQATQYYAERCMDAGVCFINAIPVFIASEPKWQQAFESRGLTCAGDDVMSQLGATCTAQDIGKVVR